jgi:hypothetical protein
MKITRRQLRRIIKEALLREGAKEDVMAYYGEIADMHSDSDAMGDLLDDLTDADLVAAGWEGGKDEAENYEDDFAAVVDALTPETLNRLVKSMDPEDLARAQGAQGEGEATAATADEEGGPTKTYAGVPIWDEIPRNIVGHKFWWLERMAHIVRDIFGGGVMYDMGAHAGVKIEPNSANIKHLRPEWEPYWPNAQVTSDSIIVSEEDVEASARLDKERRGSL